MLSIKDERDELRLCLKGVLKELAEMCSALEVLELSIKIRSRNDVLMRAREDPRNESKGVD